MVFSSTIFLFYFLPVVLILYFISPVKLRNYILLAVSLFFYGWGGGKFLFVLLASIAVNYITGLLIEKSKNRHTAKALLIFSVIMNVGLLFCFKYLNFSVSVLTDVLNKFQLAMPVSIPEIVLPIGISFFTFQGMSYVIDVYRGDVSAQKNPFYLALYISMFPQLIAGPIVRYSTVCEEIESRTSSFDGIYHGFQRFIVGLGKKVILADVLAAVADSLFSLPPASLSFDLAWCGALCYFFQIYFDFSGYSDMAIGLGQIFGFHFTENFNLPYISKSITEFWRRWHISLGSWFRDYVYIPIGGNRRGNVYVNLMVVFLLTGIWHGADFTFMIWGIWHGAFIVAERFLGQSKHSVKLPGLLKWLYTMGIVLIGWVFFRTDGIQHGIDYLSAMFSMNAASDVQFTLRYYLSNRVVFTLLIAIIISFGLPERITEKFPALEKKLEYVKPIFLLAVLFLSICMIINGNYSPFIYFRF